MKFYALELIKNKSKGTTRLFLYANDNNTTIESLKLDGWINNGNIGKTSIPKFKR